MSRVTTKTNVMHLRPEWIQTNLRILVWIHAGRKRITLVLS
jgi:hypothetical protein